MNKEKADKERVFCGDCKRPFFWCETEWQCNVEPRISFNYFTGQITSYISCSIRNEKMDCKYFERKDPVPKKKNFLEKILENLESMISSKI